MLKRIEALPAELGKAGLDRAKVERAVQLSAEKYCSASAMLAKTAAMSHSVENRRDGRPGQRLIGGKRLIFQPPAAREAPKAGHCLFWLGPGRPTLCPQS